MSAQGWRLVCVLVGFALPLFFIRELPAIGALLTLLVLAGFLTCWLRLRWFAFLLLGFVLSCFRLDNLIDRQLPQQWEGEDLKLTLVVASLPQTNTLSTRFEADIIDADEAFAWRGRLRLSWYRAPELRVGEHWQLRVRLKRPRGFVNEGVFDYQAWLLSQKIFATGYVRQADDNTRIAKPTSQVPVHIFEKLREHLDRELFALNTLQNSRFMRALLIGNKSQIAQQDWQILQTTGTLHLMAISGLHIGLIAGLGFVLGKLLVRALTFLSGSRPVTVWIAPLCSVSLAFIYAGFAGFSVPTQRALLFVVLVNVACVLGRRLNYFHALLVCAVVIALYDPFVFLSPGFYLSFGAVAVLFWCFLGRSRTDNSQSANTFAFLRAQFILFVGLFLPLALFGLPLSSVGLVTNSVAIPVVGFCIVPLLFVSAFVNLFYPPLAEILLIFTDVVLSGLWKVLTYSAQFKFGAFHYALTHPLQIVALCVLALLLLTPRSLMPRVLCVPLVLVVFFLPKQAAEFELTVLDVGQGLAVYTEWPNGNLLYDTGARFSSDFDVGSRVIAPWLQSEGVNALDFLVVSHGDNDHAGGLQGVLAALPVNTLWLGPTVTNEDSRLPTLPCNSNTTFEDADLSIEVLWPPPETKNFSSTNNASCVLVLNYQNTQILLAGDIEKDVERALLETGTLPANVDLLIAPHHGSRSSSTRAFIDTVKPRAVVFSAGYRNRYHHPNAAVVERYEKAGAQIFRTDLDGAIRFTLNTGGELDSVRARVDKARAWFW